MFVSGILDVLRAAFIDATLNVLGWESFLSLETHAAHTAHITAATHGGV